MRFPEDVPVLRDDVVTLRAHTGDDIEPAYEVCQDPEMQRWTTIPVPYERENAVHYLTEFIPAGWRDGSSWAWAIEYDGRYAGTIDLRPGDGGVGEVGFAVAPWARGHGVMTRALRLTVDYAFEQGWARVIWRAYVGNW
jgi:RimJ/RimL family protein N-acetyltransferase